MAAGITEGGAAVKKMLLACVLRCSYTVAFDEKKKYSNH